MATVKFGVFAKRRNSTKVPGAGILSDVRDPVYLKEGTSQDRPTFIVTGNNFNYNYCEWDNKYYFIEDIESLRNNEIAVHCVLDPLATYKAQILASTQFISYSASTSIVPYLVDTRVPVLKDATVAIKNAAITVLDADGKYILSTVGKNGSALFDCSITKISDVIASVNTWETAGIAAAQALINPQSISTTDFGDAISKLNETLGSIGEALINSGFVGNAYAQAPSCIRSCIWVPFGYVLHEGGDLRIWLGNFDTHVDAKRVSAKAFTGNTSIDIPWQSSGWRRAVCEQVYLYLPLVGMVSIPTNEIIKESSLTINWSATASDGVICYEVVAGSQIIGTYGGQCSANYPIGINQQASAGEMVQTAFAGTEKMLASAVNSTISPISMAAAPAAMGMTAIESAYNMANTVNTTHASCIGGIGGGAGSGLDLTAHCFTVYHPTIIPWDATDNDFKAYKATMGIPVMKSMPLTNLTGFCQCANAHVEAPATAGELNAIDIMLNSGFYIE